MNSARPRPKGPADHVVALVAEHLLKEVQQVLVAFDDSDHWPLHGCVLSIRAVG